MSFGRWGSIGNVMPCAMSTRTSGRMRRAIAWVRAGGGSPGRGGKLKSLILNSGFRFVALAGSQLKGIFSHTYTAFYASSKSLDVGFFPSYHPVLIKTGR